MNIAAEAGTDGLVFFTWEALRPFADELANVSKVIGGVTGLTFRARKFQSCDSRTWLILATKLLKQHESPQF